MLWGFEETSNDWGTYAVRQYQEAANPDVGVPETPEKSRN